MNMPHWPRPSLTSGQWNLLRSLGRVVSRRLADPDCVQADVRRLVDEGLVRIFGARMRMTLRGADALWYHHAN